MVPVVLLMGLTFLVEACFGFGGGLIAIPLLSLAMAPKDAVFLMLTFQCLKSVLLVTAWRHIDWSALKLMPIGILAGAVLGTLLLDAVDAQSLRLFLAAYLILFVAGDYWKIAWRGLPRGRMGSLFAGVSGGVISGLTGMGGPALVTYLRTQNLPKEQFRATIILALTILNLFRFALDYREILHSAAVRTYFLPCLVVFCLVMVLGSRLPKFLSEQRFKAGINLLLLLSAALLLWRWSGT